jgi:hypothetical protein
MRQADEQPAVIRRQDKGLIAFGEPEHKRVRLTAPL